jgi:hypothetical protein
MLLRVGFDDLELLSAFAFFFFFFFFFSDYMIGVLGVSSTLAGLGVVRITGNKDVGS